MKIMRKCFSMSSKRYLIKEVTCKVCEGTGTLLDMECYCEEECYNCQGKGYVVDAVDKETWFRVVTIE